MRQLSALCLSWWRLLICFQIFTEVSQAEHWAILEHPKSERIKYPTCRMIASWFLAEKKNRTFTYQRQSIHRAHQGETGLWYKPWFVPFVLKWIQQFFAGEVVSWTCQKTDGKESSSSLSLPYWKLQSDFCLLKNSSLAWRHSWI